MTKQQRDQFLYLVGYVAGFLGPDVDAATIEPDLLKLVAKHGGEPGRQFVAEWTDTSYEVRG